MQRFCDGIDPFGKNFNKNVLPTNVTYFDLVNYLVYGSHSMTFEDFKAYKSMEAYKRFESGWVQELASFKIPSGILVQAKVSGISNLVNIFCSTFYSRRNLELSCEKRHLFKQQNRKKKKR